MLYYKSEFKGVWQIIPEWSWKELQYGLRKEIITYDDITSYAKNTINENTSFNDVVFKLAFAEEDEAPSFLAVLALLEDDQDIVKIREKWIFAILSYANIHYPNQIYEIIEAVYADFDYPKSLAHLVRYMPSYGKKSISEKLKEYLSLGEEKYGT